MGWLQGGATGGVGVGVWGGVDTGGGAVGVVGRRLKKAEPPPPPAGDAGVAVAKVLERGFEVDGKLKASMMLP